MPIKLLIKAKLLFVKNLLTIGNLTEKGTGLPINILKYMIDLEIQSAKDISRCLYISILCADD